MRCTWSHRTSMSSGFSITGTQGGGALSYSMPSSLASNNPIFLRAQINQTHRNVVLDTGSGTTIINHKFLKQIQHELFRSISTFYSSANCTKINIIGEILLEIKINNICTHVNAAVAQDLVTDLLLGTDWINRYVRSIDITNKTITIHDNMGYTSTTPIIQPPDSSCLSVSLLNPITLPPYSTRSATVHTPVSYCSNALFQSSEQLLQKSIYIADSLLAVHHHQAQLLITNDTNRPYTLPRNTHLGSVSSSPLICTMSSPFSSPVFSSSPELSSRRSSQSNHLCYVCNSQFLSNNDLYRHLRKTCYPPELRQQIETLTNHIQPSTHREKVQNILWKYGKLVDIRNPSKITMTLENALDTGQHRPVYTPSYRRSLKDHQTLSEETETLLKREYIEPSTSPWNSPVVLVRKKDGGTRFCVDYRKLNDITVKDSFPLPRIDDIFDQLSQSIYFTKLDFKNGYFQTLLASQDRPKTAFSTRDNHYQFTVLPQGIKNGPPTFQRIVNQILGPTRSNYCLAYIDDVIIFSRTLDDHLSHLDEILRLLHGVNFRLSVDKCTIATDHIDYLGHHIYRGTIRPNKDNIHCLTETSVPTTSSEMFRFVKAAEYYRRFIPNFSRIAGPLYKYAPSTHTTFPQSKFTLLQFSPDEQAAFHELKRLLTTDLVLRLPNNDLPFKVQTDASKSGVGAVLLQTYPDGDHPVCYMSKKFTPSQKRWSPIEQECYAIVAAVDTWHHYLHGQRFIVESDHKPLESFTQKSQLNDKCERWRLKLQCYDFVVKHIKGVSNTMPDYLSRSPVSSASDDPDDCRNLPVITTATQTDFPFELHPIGPPLVNMVTTRSRARQQSNLNTTTISTPHTDTPSSPLPHVSPILQHLVTDPRITFAGDLTELREAQRLDPDIQHIVNNIHHPRYVHTYQVIDGLLLHRAHDSRSVPCVPSGHIRTDIMKIYHDTPANGAHFGRDKTTQKIQARY